jgi:hypothetical protein
MGRTGLVTALAGIPVTIVELDGAAINAAAGRALPYWPEPEGT